MDSTERRKNALEKLGVVHERRKRKIRSRPMSAFRMGTIDEKTRKSQYFSCKCKKRYATHSEATMTARRAEHNRGTKLRVYYCRYCNGFHLTKQVHRKDRE